MIRAREVGFELVAEVDEFSEIGRMGKHISEAGLVVVELGLSERQVLLSVFAVGAGVADDAFQSVQNGTRAVVVAGESGVLGGRSFQEDFGGLIRMQDQSEVEAAIDSQRHAGRLANPFREGIQSLRKDFCRLISGAFSARDHQRIEGVLREGSGILGEFGQLLGLAADRRRQVADISTRDELFIQVILLEDL